jgi:hypothetical protein
VLHAMAADAGERPSPASTGLKLCPNKARYFNAAWVRPHFLRICM